MMNVVARQTLDECHAELLAIKALLEGLGDGARPTPFMKRYAIMKATGVIESCFKKIIADKIDEGSHDQVKNFIKRKIRDSSSNPKLPIIQSMLSEFDSRWADKFDELLSFEDKPTLKGSLTELVNARNKFAHGGDPDVPIEDTIIYFSHGTVVLTVLDKVVNHDYSAD